MRVDEVNATTTSSVPLIVKAAKTGASSVLVMTILNCFIPVGSAVSTPALAVPPLSLTLTVTISVPMKLVAGVKVKVPAELIAGATKKEPALKPLRPKLRVWEDSFSGPAEEARKKFAFVN